MLFALYAGYMQIPVASDQTARAVMQWYAECCIGMAIQKASARHLIDRIATLRRRGLGDDNATRTTFGPDGPAEAADAYRTSRYGSYNGATPWRDIGDRH